jgi:hypothetical protein
MSLSRGSQYMPDPTLAVTTRHHLLQAQTDNSLHQLLIYNIAMSTSPITTVGETSKRAATVSITADHGVTVTINDLVLNGLLSQPQDGHASVASFRNLKYAEIPGRWFEARLVDLESQKGVWDATAWGPRPPQPFHPMHNLTGHLYPRQSLDDPMSEFECLNLNVYTPVAALQVAARNSPELLPVIVWIHGGSFEWGDGGCECGTYMACFCKLLWKWQIRGREANESNAEQHY